MIISKAAMSAPPASKAARALGCTCKIAKNKNPDLPDQYLVDPNCPLHWCLDMVQMRKEVSQTDTFIRKTAQTHTNLLLVLIVVFVFVALCYLGIIPFS